MSSLDPGIALQVKTPQVDNPVDTYTKYLTMRDMLNRGKLEQQQLQEGQENIRGAQLENQMRQRQVAGQKAVAEAVQSGTKFNQDGTVDFDHDGIEGAITRAGFPDLALGYAKDRAGMESAVLDNADKQLKVQSEKTKQVGVMAQSVLNADPAYRPDLWSLSVKQATKNGLITPQQLQSNPVFQKPYDMNTEAFLQQQADQAQTDPAGAMRARLAEKRAATQFGTEQSGREATTAAEQAKTISQVMGGIKDDAGWANARATLPDSVKKLVPEAFSEPARQQAAMLGVSPDTRATLGRYSSPTELAYAAQGGDKKAQAALQELKTNEIDVAVAKEMAPYQMLMGGGTQAAGGAVTAPGGGGPRGLSGDDFLKSLNPTVAATVKGLASGRLEFPGGFAMRSPYWQRMLGAVTQYDPNFDQTNYNTRAQLRKSYTSGPMATSNNALNTVIQHLDRLNTSTGNLGNGDYPMINQIKNFGKTQAGMNGPLNRFNTDVGAIADEATKAYRGAGGSEADIAQWKKNMSASDSPQAIRSTIAEMGDLLEGKVLANQRQFEQGMGPMADIHMLAPESEAVLAKLRGQPAPAAAGKYGDPRITESIMTMARAANRGVDDKTLAKAIKDKLDQKGPQ